MDEGVNTSLTTALRAWVQATQAFERMVSDLTATSKEAQELAARAREADPYSATALAVGSGVEGYLEHGQVSFWLAQQAVQMDARSPLACLFAGADRSWPP